MIRKSIIACAVALSTLPVIAGQTLENYYLVPFVGGQPANSGYVPCDGTSYRGYWQNNEGHAIYLSVLSGVLATNLPANAAVWAEAVYWFEAPGSYAKNWLMSLQISKANGTQNFFRSFEPNSYMLPAGAKVWVSAICSTNSGSTSGVPSWLPGPTLQANAFVHFRDNP